MLVTISKMFHIFSKFTHLIQGTTRYPLCFTAKFSTEFLSVLLHPALILWIDFSNSAILSNASQRWVRADWEFRLAQVLDSQLRCWLCVHCGVVGWRGDLVYVSSHWYLPPHLCFFRSFPSSFQSHFIHPTSDPSLWNLWPSKLSAYLKWWSSKKPPRSPRSLKTKALWFVKLKFFFSLFHRALRHDKGTSSHAFYIHFYLTGFAGLG